MKRKLTVLMLILAVTLVLSACVPGTCVYHIDTDKNAKCDICNADVACTACIDTDKNAKCDVCGKDVPCTECIDADKNAKCDICGKDVPCTSCIDVNKDSKCDVCEKDVPCTSCIDTVRDGKCDVCGKDVPCTECIDKVRDGKCDICGKDVPCTECIDADKNAKCDICGKDVECEACTDTDKNAKCDVCGKDVECEACTDTDKNEKCDVCGKDVECEKCIDYDYNGVCDVCKKDLPCLICCDVDHNFMCDSCGSIVFIGTHICMTSLPDGICDICGENLTVDCTDHVDANGDGKCDTCNESADVSDPCAKGHTNEDADGRCDICGAAIKHIHYDSNGDDKCDICSFDMSDEEDEEEYGPVPWEKEDPIELFFMMSKNTDVQQNPSGCERYLAGMDTTKRENIDDEIATRNSDAEYYTNVKISYEYYPDVAEYGWGNCIEIMFANVFSNARDVPDMYCNFTYDMVGASLKGTFHNLKNTGLDQGNFFSFLDDDYDEDVDNRGYMYEYMKSTSLSIHKMYVLASDYFIDIIRSIYVVPVNIELLESAGMEITGDLDNDERFTIKDFYEEVYNKKWTYSKVMAYSAKVFRNTGTASAAEDIEDVLGFALARDGITSSGMLYSNDITIINKEWSDSKGDYEYSYPQESEELYTLFDNIKTLVTSPGVVYVSTSGEYADPNVTKYGSDARTAIRNRFCDNKILFGGIITLGALEYQEYQTLKDAYGFGVVPVPLYHEVALDDEESYVTTIHSSARTGGIAKSTPNFTACTAFLDYQSTHSTHILDEYYDYNLQYNYADGAPETIEMLQFIRKNIRSSFDQIFEDAIGVYNNLEEHRWHHILSVNGYQYDIRADYAQLRLEKEKWLETLHKEYSKLP